MRGIFSYIKPKYRLKYPFIALKLGKRHVKSAQGLKSTVGKDVRIYAKEGSGGADARRSDQIGLTDQGIMAQNHVDTHAISGQEAGAARTG